MPTHNRPRAQIKHTTQNILNYTYDEDFEVLAVELLGYDDSVNPPVLRRLKTNTGGNLSSSSASEKIIYASDATYEYFAFAPPGSSTASTIWKVIRIDGNGQITHADGNANYDNAATNIAALTYS